jgi:hypothetical protein
VGNGRYCPNASMISLTRATLFASTPRFSSSFTSTAIWKRVQSSRRLEREAGRNVEVMWLLGRAWFTAIMLAGLRGQISEKRIYVGLDVSS